MFIKKIFNFLDNIFWLVYEYIVYLLFRIKDIPSKLYVDLKDMYIEKFKVKKLNKYYFEKLNELSKKYNVELNYFENGCNEKEVKCLKYKNIYILWLNPYYNKQYAKYLSYFDSMEVKPNGYKNKYYIHFYYKSTNKYLSYNDLSHIIENFFKQLKEKQIELKKKELETDFSN